MGVLSDVLVCRLDTEYLPSSLPVTWSSSDDTDEDDDDDVIDRC